MEDDSRRKGLLLLTDEEARRLADAVKNYHVPRSLLILEAIQVGLENLDPTAVPGKRSKPAYYRLPVEIREKARQVAAQFHLTQQSLIRHMVFAYLPTLNPSAQRTRNVAERKPRVRA